MKQLIIFLLFSNLLSAQVLNDYPKGQDFYKGGEKQFFKELNEALVSSGLKPCENKKEAIYMKILVHPDSHISFVQEPDVNTVENNKCAYNLVKKALAKLDNFTPAIYESEKTPAIASFVFYPDDFFENFKNNYKPSNDDYKLAEFPDGINEFRDQFYICFKNAGFSSNMDFKFDINFEVSSIGVVQNMFISKNFKNDKFTEMIIECISTKNIRFKPGTFKNTPIISKFRMPVSIQSRL